EPHDAVAFRIVDGIGEYRRALRFRSGALQPRCQILAIENVVAENQAARVFPYERAPDDERLRQTAWLGLNGIAQFQAPPRAVAKQLLESRCVQRRGDDQDLPDPGQ